MKLNLDDAWIQSYRGGQIHPLNPKLDELHVEDFSHSLSNLCRFGGHTKRFYSIGQHCVLVSQACDQEYALEGLLHDAAEGCGLVDMPSPVKHSKYLSGYRLLDEQMEEAIAEKFKLKYPWPKTVKQADMILLMTERRDLMAPPPVPWMFEEFQVLPKKIVPWSPKVAEKKFLERYYELEERRKIGK
jgi:hypothetical protein